MKHLQHNQQRSNFPLSIPCFLVCIAHLTIFLQREYSLDYRCSRLYSLEVLFLIIEILLSSGNNGEQYVILFIPPNSL